MEHPYAFGMKIAMQRLGLRELPLTSALTCVRHSWLKVAMPVPPPGAAPAAAQAAPSLLGRLGNTKVPLKVLGGMGALAGGAMMAHQATQQPTLEVQPSLPLRTVFP